MQFIKTSIISQEANTGWKGHCSKRSTKLQNSSQGLGDFPGTNKTVKTDACVFLRKKIGEKKSQMNNEKKEDNSDAILGRQVSRTTVKQYGILPWRGP